jgi:DNA-binding SARP family transcriptional activator
VRVVRLIIRLAGRLGALVALLALLAGVPAGLWHFVGWPLPRRVPTDWAGWERILTSRFPDEAVANLLAVALWLVWAAFAYSVWVEWRAARGAQRRQLPTVFSPMQALAALLIAAISTGPVALAAAPPAPPPAVVQVHPNPTRTVADLADPHGRWRLAPTAHPDTSVAPAAKTMRANDLTATPVSTGRLPRFAAAGFDGPLCVQVGAHHYTYTVRKHDTLWDIAGAWLGDHTRWPEIYHLNADRYDQHGRMRHGDHIEPGWVLVLPDDARPPAGAQPAPPPTATPPPSTGASPTPPAASPSPPAASPSASTAAPSASPATAPSGTPDNDGVVIPAPTGSAVPSQPAGAQPSPATATSGSASPTSAPAGPDGHHDGSDHGGPGIELPGGGWVAAPLAAAVAAAAALVWIQRRRRYRPRSPGSGDRDDADLVPLPRTIAALHRARPAPTIEYDAEDELVDDMEHLQPEAREAAAVTAASFGIHANRPLRLPDLPALGVGLTGPGAHDAARGVLAAALSAGGPWAPGDEATITTTAADLATLLGPDAADRYPLDRLHVADTIDDALTHLERQLLRRARLATDHDGADLTTLHPDNPDQPLPPIMFLAAAPDGPIATALAAILAVGSRMAIAGLLLGPWPTGATWHVNTDGTTHPDGAATDSGPRLNVLDTTATADILDTLRQARPASNDLPPPPQPSHPTAPILYNAAAKPTTPTTPAQLPSVKPDHIPPPLAAETARTDGQPPAAESSTPAASRPRLRLSVLGKPALHLVTGDTTTEVRIRRSHGVQILVHLAIAPDGATSDELMAALWPEARPHYSRGRFHTNIHELRDTLAEAADAEAIPRTDERYRLDPAHLDVDVWRLTAAARRAATTVEPAHHADALREVIKLYTGPVAEGHTWLWLAPYRETIRRHVLDAYIGLADTETNPTTALALVQEAIRLDPYNEDVYQRAMRLHATLNSPDGVTRTLRTLTERLTELEIEVSPQTQQVATDLLAKLEARRRNRGNAA